MSATAPALTGANVAALTTTPAPVAAYERDLPWNIKRITDTGGRPVYSPDGTRIAYVRSVIGDAYEVDLKTGITTDLTAGADLHWFTRVHYLPNGDYILVGSAKADTVATLDQDQELWMLKAGTTTPVRLGAKCYDGLAVSRLTNTIAWGDNNLLDPGTFPVHGSSLFMAQVTYPDGVPTLANKRVVVSRPSTYVNGQDFRNNDSEIIFADYKGPIASVLGANVKTGALTVYRSFTNEYNEPEGIFPDGKSILVESSRDKGAGHQTAQYIDIWKLTLTANSTHFERITRIGDDGPFKASNPVVSPDGRYIAFQVSIVGTAAGVGDGIFLLDTRTVPTLDKTIFNGNFQSGVAPNWSATPSATAQVQFAAAHTVLSATSTTPSSISITRTINTAGATALSVRLLASQSGINFGANDWLKIEVNDGTGWKRIFTDAGRYQGLDDATPEGALLAANTTPTWTNFIPLPIKSGGQKSIQIRITCQTTSPAKQ
ncbi:MAG TPA: hypothetical protein VH370_12820, partial [Humisphaera sp.]|nr:hypothetical protein [Humisphaera sp.]